MKVSLEWVKEFVDVQASPREVADRLTMAGLEIEGMEPVGDDIILEVNVTPNRPDCLSMLGVAREVAAAFDLTLKVPATGIQGDLPVSEVAVEILDPALCNRYTGRQIKGVTVGDTPEWMKQRLERCGVRSLNNNIVDITNYVLLELGHPLHAFDADKLFGSAIRVARSGERRKITTLDGAVRELSEDMLLIWDGKEPVAIAGVMGGAASSVTSETRNIFLESAYFEPTSVRRTSKGLGLKTESSYRFERGTDIVFLENALNRAALLMQETGGGMIHGIVDAYPERYVPPAVEAGYERVNALLGTSIAKEEMRALLGGIGIRTEDGGEKLIAFPPPFRRDVRAYYDIVEEVARTYGFGNIAARNPKTGLSAGILNKRERNVGRVKEAIRMSGFTEVVNYSFMNEADLDMLMVPPDDFRRRQVRVLNPLRQEDSLMRTTLVPSLLKNFVYNLSRGTRDIRFFECARVFIDGGGPLPLEELMLGGILFRENVPALWKEETPPFFVVKGALDSLCGEMKIKGFSYVPSDEMFLHRGKSADVLLGGAKVGFIGELTPGVVEKLDLKVLKPEIVVFELNLERLYAAVPETLTYSPIPKYPAIERDIAIILDEGLSSAGVMEELKGYRSEYIEKVELFDHYKGKNIPQGKKSLGYRITYRSPERTLTDEEVETIHTGLVAYILQRTGGELRGA
jgi:phenylalanyl-tRNA synthetase beta chain